MSETVQASKPSKNKWTSLNVYMETRDLAREIADRNGMTMAEVIRRALESYAV